MLFSRNVEVAEHVNREGFIYQPECLNEEQSWELLKLKAVPRGYHRGRYFTCIYYVSFTIVHIGRHLFQRIKFKNIIENVQFNDTRSVSTQMIYVKLIV